MCFSKITHLINIRLKQFYQKLQQNYNQSKRNVCQSKSDRERNKIDSISFKEVKEVLLIFSIKVKNRDQISITLCFIPC